MSDEDFYSGNNGGFKPKKKKWNANAPKKDKIPFYKREIEYNEQKLKVYAINKLAKQDWGRKELFTKMSRYQKDHEIINKVLDLLEKLGYLSDKRRINGVLKRFENIESVTKTSQRLSAKGFTKEQIKEVIEEKKEQEEFEDKNDNVPFTVLERKFRNFKGSIPSYSYEEKQKLKEKMTRFLAGRGFSFDLIRNAMNQFFDSIEEDT